MAAILPRAAILMLAGGCLSAGTDPVVPVTTGIDETKVLDALTAEEHTELCRAAGATRVSVDASDAHCWAFAFEATVIEASPRTWTDQEARDSCHRVYRDCKAEPPRPAADGCEFSPADAGRFMCRMTVGQAEACLTLGARLRHGHDRSLPPCKDVTIALLREYYNRPPPQPPTDHLPCTTLDLAECPPYLTLGP